MQDFKINRRKIEKEKTILIASTLNTTVGDHYLELLKVYSKLDDARLLFISDKFRTTILTKQSNPGILFFDWPTKRPDNLKSFLWGLKLFWKFKPDVVIGNFGSTWMVMILSCLFRTKSKLIHYHTPSNQMKLDFKPRVIRTRLLGFLFRNIADKIIVSSNFVKNDLINIHKVNTERILLVPFLLGENIITNRYLNKPEEEIIFFYPGRLYPSKGHLDFIENIFWKITQKYSKAKLIINGSGPLKSEIENKIIQLGLINNVKIQNPTTYIEYLNNLKCSTFTCGLSFSEGFGLVFLEALSQGSIVISRNLQPMNEFIPNRSNLLLDDYDYETLLEKLFDLIENTIKYVKYCEENLDWVKNNYSVDKKGKEYAHVLFSY